MILTNYKTNDVMDFVERADKALIETKHSVRNRITVANRTNPL